MHTVFGKTAQLVEEPAGASESQQAVAKIARYLIILSLTLVAVMTATELWRGQPILTVIQFALILVVASIPAAMPTVRYDGGWGYGARTPQGNCFAADKEALKDYKQIHFKPFDYVNKRTEAEIRADRKTIKTIKGAPQNVLELIKPKADLKKAEAAIEDLAKK